MINTYDEAVSYLKSFIPFTLYNTDAYKKTAFHDPLDRMRYLLELLENPEKKFRSVLIGGTSGKGSTSYFISHILTTAGYKTGLTLSPHLVRINERIQINNLEISDSDFVSLIKTVQPAIEKMKESAYGVPSYFEITIAIAFLHFAAEKVDIAVIEVGMGGVYDATNVLEPLIAILTNVSLDHTQFLGDTVEEIAKTKVGIIKNYKNLVIVTGVIQPLVIKIVEERCEKVGAKLFRLGKDFFSMSSRGAKRRGNLENYVLGLPGEYQKENASLAIETIKQLHQFDFTVDEKDIRKALNTATFPGRFEIVNYTLNANSYTLILDGAHNPAKMQAFVTSLQVAYPKEKKIFVIAFKKDKNIEDMVKEILPVASNIIVTEFQIGTDTMISHAAMDIETIQSLLSKCKFPMKHIYLEKDSVKAIEKAISLCQSDHIVAVTGSLYLIGELKQKLTSLV